MIRFIVIACNVVLVIASIGALSESRFYSTRTATIEMLLVWSCPLLIINTLLALKSNASKIWNIIELYLINKERELKDR